MHADREISTNPSTSFFSKASYKGEELLSNMMPPRRTWSEAGCKRRESKLKNSQSRIKFALRMTYSKALKQEVKPNWLLNFESFCDQIRAKVDNISNIGFNPPNVFAIEKKKLNGKVEYRPIVQYELIDRIIIGLSARYFVNILDSEFYENSFAFRKVTTTPITHNTAFQKIIDFANANKDNKIYVAECDIRKFYDCINHGIVKSRLELLIERLKKKGISFSNDATSVLIKYLQSFSFYNNILSVSTPEWFEERKCHRTGFFGWELTKLEENFAYGFNTTDFFPVGVPQGGALSCVISNIVLDDVDRKVTLNSDGQLIDPELLYLRYCDDMIILHTNLKKCIEALERYKNAIKQSMLLIHETEKLFFSTKYSKNFWEGKSKPIYEWGESTKAHHNRVPWLSFVGYQLRYDFKVRARNQSVIKHNKKLKSEYHRIIKVISDKKGHECKAEHMRVKKGSILGMFKRRMISLSVGHPTLYNLYAKNYELCWANGFKLLSNRNKIAALQLRRFDRKRGELTYKLNKKIPNPKKKNLGSPDEKKFNKIYLGRPFSYYGILVQKRKARL